MAKMAYRNKSSEESKGKRNHLTLEQPRHMPNWLGWVGDPFIQLELKFSRRKGAGYEVVRNSSQTEYKSV